MDFTKKFNIGLTLETNYSKFEAFIKEYHPYIHSVYFSPPLGRLFHTRSKVAGQMLLPGKRKMFLKMLSLCKSYDIKLELLLNTLRLDDALIKKAAEYLAKQGIEVDSVCFLEKNYASVQKYFPNQTYIWSFNNGFCSKKEFDRIIDHYRADVFVLGSLFIRNNAFFAYLAERGKKTYLLLNNGCSFNCDTCNNIQSVCEQSFKKNLKTHSVEYLYALQSIFPEELHEGIIDSTHITCFKISNRSSDLEFIQGAVDSYMSGEVRAYVQKDKNNYAYWGRAGYFWKYFATMDLDKILAYKQRLLFDPAKRK